MEATALAGSVLVIAGAIVWSMLKRENVRGPSKRVGQRTPGQRRRRQLPGSTKTYPLPGFQARGFLAALGRNERTAPVTRSATTPPASSLTSLVASPTCSPTSAAAMRALAGCELSELFTRAAAAAVAAATRALARISRPRSELTRLSSAFFSVHGIRTPITLVDAREDFLIDAREDFWLARVAPRTFALDDLDACEA